MFTDNDNITRVTVMMIMIKMMISNNDNDNYQGEKVLGALLAAAVLAVWHFHHLFIKSFSPPRNL